MSRVGAETSLTRVGATFRFRASVMARVGARVRLRALFTVRVWGKG